MSQEKQTQTEIGIAGVVRNQGASEINSSRRHEHICNRVGRSGWSVITVIIAVGVLTGCFTYNHIQKLKDKIGELEANVALSGDNKALKAQNAAMGKAIKSKNNQILALHAAADREKEMHHKYYKHMGERAEGYIDHIMSLNEQLEEANKNTERFKIRNNTKKQFTEMSFAIAENSPPRFKEAIGDDILAEMKFYPLVVKMAIGLGSLDILDYIQSIDGWDKTIPSGLVNHVKNPEHVPLKRYEQLRAKGKKAQNVMNQLKGRIADQEKTISAHNALIKELKGKIYDEKYLPNYSTQQVMYNSAYHTVAENVRPKDLKKWVGKATPEEWIGYLRMAVARNSNNVYEAIMELDEVTSIPEVAAYINATEVLAVLSDVAKKHQENIGAIRDHQKKIDDQIEDYAESVKQQLDGQ
jgi:outer membrane murein-binding lipoprotein Lpp